MEQEKTQVCEAVVVSNKPKAKDIWELKLDPGDDFDVTAFLPGQFVCLAPLDSSSTMARPFSIANISTSNGTFFVLYKVIGKNTELMTKLASGDKVKFWGPLGQGFLPCSSPDPDYDEVWLVGGGIGIAPLIFFEKVMTEYQDRLVRVFYGNKTKDEIIPLDLYTQEPLTITTDDGSAGYKGFVSDVFASFIQAAKNEKILVITCGPNVMMAKVAELCEQAGIECQVILETVMACGLGVCLGCSIKTASGMKRICHDGPVFPAKEVWDVLS
ncbi:MAG: dihydroorotate dehydrogenase electron transfer subunit [Candidatus Parcubacteria bacterium]|nr:dihydroorotate dehydrogenase electron transfer subunit [Candidatus Parcubacteria bacterium]